MVEQQGSTAQSISMQADQEIHTAKIIMIALSIVAVISAIMVAWLYVGRDVVRRLGRLSEAMRELAGGNRDVHIQDTRGDEIAKMAHSIEVFRENAVALDELLAEREEASVRLEKVVEQRTRELRRRGEELRVTFDNMVQGVLMFDGAMKVAAWNRQVLELLKITRELPRRWAELCGLHSLPCPARRIRRCRSRSGSAAVHGHGGRASYLRTNSSRRNGA